MILCWCKHTKSSSLRPSSHHSFPPSVSRILNSVPTSADVRCVSGCLGPVASPSHRCRECNGLGELFQCYVEHLCLWQPLGHVASPSLTTTGVRRIARKGKVRFTGSLHTGLNGGYKYSHFSSSLPICIVVMALPDHVVIKFWCLFLYLLCEVSIQICCHRFFKLCHLLSPK
jgi:hypothetical protein